jgi:hypothetical protein
LLREGLSSGEERFAQVSFLKRGHRVFTSSVVVFVERVMLEIVLGFCYSRAPQSLPMMRANSRAILEMKFKWG